MAATAGSIASQGIGVATGLQNHFDWTGVAAAGIGAGAFQQAGIGLRGSGLSASATRGVAGLAGDIANAAARSLIGGTDFGDNIIAALPDTIGQTVGSMVASRISGPMQSASSDPLAGKRYAALDVNTENYGSDASQSESITVSAQRLPKWQEDLWQAYYGIGNLVNDASRYVGNQYSKSQVVQARAERERAAVIARPVAQFAQGHPRLLGTVQAVGGTFEAVSGFTAAVAGAASSEVGIGIPVAIGGGALAIHGIDDLQAGLTTVFNGTPTPTLTNRGLQAVGLTPQQADFAEFAGTLTLGLSSGVGALRFGSAAERSLLSNTEARVWYNQQLETLDTAGPLTESTAARVHGARNALKQQTRDLMSDRPAAEQLARERPLEPFQYYVDKYTAQGYKGEALWQRIIQSGATPNPTVNSKFGIK